MSTLKREEILNINQKGWNEVAPLFYGGTAMPKYGPLASTEDDLNLVSELGEGKVLELGCGSGHTLSYLWESKKATELWGLDFSAEQLRLAREYLDGKNIPARLILSSMDENPGIPSNYFDLVISIYALGWTPDLTCTLELVYSYLKPRGVFIFSWEHPVYRCLNYHAELDKFIFERSYSDEFSEHYPSWKGVEIVINHRKLSTYLNAVAQSGLVIDRVIESSVNVALAREQDFDPDKWYSVPRAKVIPTTFIVRAYRPYQGNPT